MLRVGDLCHQEPFSDVVFIRAEGKGWNTKQKWEKQLRPRSFWPLNGCTCPHPQYDFVELLDGSRLIAREQRNLLEPERAGRQARSVSLHEAGFIQYLDSGIWHLAFYNDGKNTEQVSFNTIVIGKSGLQSIFFRAIACTVCWTETKWSSPIWSDT